MPRRRVAVVELPPLLTAAEFSAGTGGKVDATDPRIQPLIDGATAAIRRHCGWHVGPVIEEDVRMDGSGGSVLVVPSMRVVDITGVIEDGRAWTAEEVADLEWSAAGMVRAQACRHWTSRYRGVTFSLRHGFDDFADVKQIVQQVVANALSSPMGATREQAGQVSISWSTTAPGVSGGLSLLERDMATLASYKLAARW